MWSSITGSACFRILFGISSGPGALFGESWLMAVRICRMVIGGRCSTSLEYIVDPISDTSAGEGCGKNVF